MLVLLSSFIARLINIAVYGLVMRAAIVRLTIRLRSITMGLSRNFNLGHLIRLIRAQWPRRQILQVATVDTLELELCWGIISVRI